MGYSQSRALPPVTVMSTASRSKSAHHSRELWSRSTQDTPFTFTVSSPTWKVSEVSATVAMGSFSGRRYRTTPQAMRAAHTTSPMTMSSRSTRVLPLRWAGMVMSGWGKGASGSWAGGVEN